MVSENPLKELLSQTVGAIFLPYVSFKPTVIDLLSLYIHRYFLKIIISVLDAGVQGVLLGEFFLVQLDTFLFQVEV